MLAQVTRGRANPGSGSSKCLPEASSVLQGPAGTFQGGGLGYFHQGENPCTLYIFGPLVREEPGGALYVHSPQASPIVLPSTGVKADVYLQCLTTLLMGGIGLSRPGGNLGFRV